MFQPGNPKRVLIADDDPLIRRMVVALVQKLGFIPVPMVDGREAFRTLRKDSDFVAAIFDMNMPYLEGLEVIRFMKTEKRLMRIPVMMITSESDLKLPSKSFNAVAALFLPKPFSIEQFQSSFRLLIAQVAGQPVEFAA